jgi:hypothetical protein
MCVIYDVATRFCSIYLDYFSAPGLKFGIWAYEQLVLHADPEEHDFEHEHELDWDQKWMMNRYFDLWIGIHHVPRKSGPIIHGDTLERYLNPNVRTICLECLEYLGQPFDEKSEDIDESLISDQKSWAKLAKSLRGKKLSSAGDPPEVAPQYSEFNEEERRMYFKKMREGQKAYEAWIEKFVDSKLPRPKKQPQAVAKAKAPPPVERSPSVDRCPMCEGNINSKLLREITTHPDLDGPDSGLGKHGGTEDFIKKKIEGVKAVHIKEGWPSLKCTWCGNYYGNRKLDKVKQIYAVREVFGRRYSQACKRIEQIHKEH